MDTAGLKFRCVECHTSTAHQIEGRFYSIPATTEHTSAMPQDKGSRIACESCHSERPHKTNEKLNDHTNRVACETCHISRVARIKPTLVWWDWSKAGEFTSDGNFIVKKDEMGNVSYHTKKGELGWAKNVVPEYLWFNGQVHGDSSDPKAKIYPFKMFRGKQIYDVKNKTLLVPKLFGPKGSGAFWQDFDWDKSVAMGQTAAEREFSGTYGFIETEYLRPIAHMVTPKEDALSCDGCHSHHGRLEKLTGFYMPGRDAFAGLDRIGWFACLGLLGAVGVHGFIRISTRGRRKKQ